MFIIISHTKNRVMCANVMANNTAISNFNRQIVVFSIPKKHQQQQIHTHFLVYHCDFVYASWHKCCCSNQNKMDNQNTMAGIGQRDKV